MSSACCAVSKTYYTLRVSRIYQVSIVYINHTPHPIRSSGTNPLKGGYVSNFVGFRVPCTPRPPLKKTPSPHLAREGFWCRRWESNPHSRGNTSLSRARLPIPPHYFTHLFIPPVISTDDHDTNLSNLTSP